MSRWHELPIEFPTDGHVVWVRRMWWSMKFLATWHVATAEFETSSGFLLPWFVVAKWAAQTVPP